MSGKDYKFKVRGGNSGMYKDGVVYGGMSACIRAAQIRHDLGDGKEDMEHSTDYRKMWAFSIGYAIEPIVAKRERNNSGKEVLEDVLIQKELAPDACFEGHKDIEFKDGPIIEHKTIQSFARAKETMVDNGKWKEAYLYQLGKYMLYSRNPNGMLMFTVTFNTNSFTKHKVKYNFKAMDSKIFYVEIRNDGEIMVGEKKGQVTPVGFNVKDLHAHTLLALEWMRKDEIYPFPPENLYTTDPGCQYCPFKDVCDKFDSDRIKTRKEFMGAIQAQKDESGLANKVDLDPITF